MCNSIGHIETFEYNEIEYTAYIYKQLRMQIMQKLATFVRI